MHLLGVTTLSNLVKVKYNLTPHVKVFTQYTYMSLCLCFFSFRVTHCKIFTADTSGNAILGPGLGLGVTVCKRCYCQPYVTWPHLHSSNTSRQTHSWIYLTQTQEHNFMSRLWRSTMLHFLVLRYVSDYATRQIRTIQMAKSFWILWAYYYQPKQVARQFYNNTEKTL